MEHLLSDEIEGAWLFAYPVDPVEWGIEDYFSVVKHPMDFSTIKDRLQQKNFYLTPEVSSQTDHYVSCVTLQQFISDVELVFSNCILYNSGTSKVGKLCYEVRDAYQKFAMALGLLGNTSTSAATTQISADHSPPPPLDSPTKDKPIGCSLDELLEADEMIPAFEDQHPSPNARAEHQPSLTAINDFGLFGLPQDISAEDPQEPASQHPDLISPVPATSETTSSTALETSASLNLSLSDPQESMGGTPDEMPAADDGLGWQKPPEGGDEGRCAENSAAACVAVPSMPADFLSTDFHAASFWSDDTTVV